jgi:hypothetical protein
MCGIAVCGSYPRDVIKIAKSEEMFMQWTDLIIKHQYL